MFSSKSSWSGVIHFDDVDVVDDVDVIDDEDDSQDKRSEDDIQYIG